MSLLTLLISLLCLCWIKVLISLKNLTDLKLYKFIRSNVLFGTCCMRLIVHGCIFRRRGLCLPLSGLWSFSLATLCMCITRSVQRNFTTGTVSFIRFRLTIIPDFMYQTSICFYVILDVVRALLFFLPYSFEKFNLLHVVILQSDLSFYVCVYQHLWVFSFPIIYHYSHLNHLLKHSLVSFLVVFVII